MKTLYLLRHAKSSWADTGIGDLDRPWPRAASALLRRSPTTCVSKG
jgi:phosphohistidine phosphatase SixA